MSVVLALSVISAASPGMAQYTDLTRELDQGWTAKQRAAWYEARQGSRLIPLAWLNALEQPDSQILFMQPEHLAKFRYLPQRSATGEQLAVGFAIDRQDDKNLKRTQLRWRTGQSSTEPWVGMTCAACHTAELSYQGKPIRIDGGPALADFQSFIEQLNKALRETSSSEAKCARFASRVLPGGDNNEKNRGTLKRELERLVAWQEREAEMNQTALRYGFGRVDAFGHIFNKVALLVDAPTPKPNPSDAPVSIPFIWHAPQLDRVQYNGMAPKYSALFGSFDAGALARNTGEMIGVFGDVNVNSKPSFSGYPSSIDVRNLVALEKQLMALRPPKWPTKLFGLDDKLVEEGRGLYKQHCASCHALVDRTNLRAPIKVQMNLFDGSNRSEVTGEMLPPPGTDPWMACNAYAYESASGVFKGAPSAYFDGDPIDDPAPLSNLLAVTVTGSLLGRKWEVSKEAAAAFFRLPRPPLVEGMAGLVPTPQIDRSPEKLARLELCMSARSTNLGYSSRPLNGIWATAPYLHNGSVPTLYDLLLPPDQRPSNFYIGMREFDPKNVGLVTEKENISEKRAIGNTFLFEARGMDGRHIDGNSNAGHDYSNDQLSDEQRRALVEYLKVL